MRRGVYFIALCIGMTLLGSIARANNTDGVTDTEIKLGMVNAQSGPAAGLGKGMRLGAEAVFKEVNAKGGINGRKISLVVADDGYEPDKAVDETLKMIEEQKVFGLFGYVGTPTSNAVLPIIKDTHVPLVGLFTGSMALRQPVNPDIINIRASYDDEAEALVAYFIKTKNAKKFAIFYQEDGFGQAVLSGTEKALKKRSMALVGKGTFQRNTLAVKAGIAAIAPTAPDVVIMVGPYAPLAAFVKEARANGLKSDLGTVSFVGTDDFFNTVGAAGEGVVISQVVPFPGDPSVPIVKECQELLAKYAPGEKLGFVSLEGAISAKALELAGHDLSREAVIHAFESMSNLDMGGMVFQMSKDDHQASNTVFLTQIQGGKVTPIK